MDGIEIRPFREEDAAGLAELLNASDAAWPGTFTGGIAYTAERVLEHSREEDYLLDLVAEAGGKIVGTCTLTRDWDDPQAAYVSFLNVHPDWHGKGIGRRLLISALKGAIGLGAPYVTLDTWSGNERAIPLYKKTGFFWIPGTDVRMENYLPQILRLPWTKEFLGDVHWYGCLKREITLEEDREEWRGREVFRYVFEREGRRLEVVIDRAAKAPCAVFAPDFSAEIWLEPAKPWSAIPFKLRWRLVNRARAPRLVALSVHGDPGIKISGGKLLSLEPGEEGEGECRGSASPDLQAEPHRPLPAVRLALLSEGDGAEFACGVEGKPPLEVSCGPAPLFVCPDTPRRVRLSLVSHYEGTLEGKVSLAPCEGLSLEPHSWDFCLSSGEAEVLEVDLEARPGAHVLGGRVELSSGETWEISPLPILSRGPGQTIGCLLGDRALMAGDWGWLEARARGGRLVLFRHGGTHPVLRQGEELGPPFFPSDLGQRRWELRLERSPAGVRLTMEADSGRFPGVRLKKEVLSSPGNLMRISYSASSHREAPLPVQLRVVHWDLPDLPWEVSFRAHEALISNPLGAFPEGKGDFPEELAEDWLSLGTKGWTVGLIPEGKVTWDCTRGWSWKTELRELPPGRAVALHRYLLYIGPGDFTTVRGLWAEERGVTAIPEEPRPFVWVEPSRTVLIGERGQLGFRVRTARGQPFSGMLSLTPPEGISLAQAEFPLSEVKRGKPVELGARWAKTGAIRAGMGKLVLRGMGEERRFPWWVIALPQGKPEVAEGEREGQRVFTIGAGKTRFQVAPSFAGSLISWREKGEEWLLVGFPRPRAFTWLSPWFGGIYPILYELSLDEWNWPGRLHREEFRGERWAGEFSEIPLSGVRLLCEPRSRDLRGLSLEVIYASPGEGILLSLLRVRNSGRPRRLSGGFLGFLRPEGELRDTVLYSPGRVRIRSPYHAGYEARGWSLVRAPSGAGILLVVPPQAVAAIWDAGEEGRHLGIARDFRLDPGEEALIWGWWVALQPREPFEPWLALSHVSRA